MARATGTRGLTHQGPLELPYVRGLSWAICPTGCDPTWESRNRWQYCRSWPFQTRVQPQYCHHLDTRWYPGGLDMLACPLGTRSISSNAQYHSSRLQRMIQKAQQNVESPMKKRSNHMWNGRMVFTGMEWRRWLRWCDALMYQYHGGGTGACQDTQLLVNQIPGNRSNRAKHAH
jgi:hypothetical protein